MDSSAIGPLPPLYQPNSPVSNIGTPDKAVMLQRYMALYSQQNIVRRRLSEDSQAPSSRPKLSLSTSSSPDSSPEMSSSEASSTASSPTLSGQSFSSIPPPAYALSKPSSRKSGSPPLMSPIPEDESTESPSDLTMPPMSPDETKFTNINTDIRATLTALLNCEVVRNDGKMRLWVQTRLMDAELELKRQRKRRRSTPTIVVSPSDEAESQIS